MTGIRIPRLLCTGLAALVLIGVAGALLDTRFSWIGGPIFSPGLLAAALFLPEGAHSNHAEFYLPVAAVLDFFLIWLILWWGSNLYKRWTAR